MTLVNDMVLFDDILCLMQGKYNTSNIFQSAEAMSYLKQTYGVNDPFDLSQEQGKEYLSYLKGDIDA